MDQNTKQNKTLPKIANVLTILMIVIGVIYVMSGLSAFFLKEMGNGLYLLIFGVLQIMIAISLRKLNKNALFGLIALSIVGIITSIIYQQISVRTFVYGAIDLAVIFYFWNIFKKI